MPNGSARRASGPACSAAVGVVCAQPFASTTTTSGSDHSAAMFSVSVTAPSAIAPSPWNTVTTAPVPAACSARAQPAALGEVLPRMPFDQKPADVRPGPGGS